MPRLNLRPLKAEVRSLARVTSLDKFVILFIMIHATQNKVHVSIGYKFIIVLMVFLSELWSGHYQTHFSLTVSDLLKMIFTFSSLPWMLSST